jgi:signal peptidase II
VSSALHSSAPVSQLGRRVVAFWSLFGITVVTDVVTTRLAERGLTPQLPHDVVGEWIRLTLTYNTGAAMNVSLGSASRGVLAVVASAMLIIIFRMYRRTPQHDAAQAAALALIAGGALGNLIDRLRSIRGVVDFIDLGMGDWRFWTFNVADLGVTTGATLLALLLIRRPTVPGDEG